jgi:hypothetical protein
MHIKFWSGNLKELSFRRPRRRWEDNIKLDHKETVGRCGLDGSGSR